MTRFLLSLCLGVLSLRAAENLPKPNIIFFMADDMGMGDTSAYQDFTGNTDAVQLHTPQMERLARMGMRFTDAHTPSSRCTPTRYGLLTGRYPWRSRMKWWVLFGALICTKVWRQTRVDQPPTTVAKTLDSASTIRISPPNPGTT